MAARIMIEDCLALLLDVQDVDRLFAASPSARLIHVPCKDGFAACECAATCTLSKLPNSVCKVLEPSNDSILFSMEPEPAFPLLLPKHLELFLQAGARRGRCRCGGGAPC